MTIRLMRTPLPSTLFRAQHAVTPGAATAEASVFRAARGSLSRRLFAKVRDRELLSNDLWFSSTAPKPAPETLGGGEDGKPPDERTLKLGKSEFNICNGKHLHS